MKPPTIPDQAADKLLAGYNCAQAVLHANRDRLPVDQNLASRLATGFGAGMGREGEVCGAVTGGILALGLVHGRADGEDKSKTEATYAKTQEFLGRFKARHGSLLCRELVHCDLRTPEGQAYFKLHGLLQQTCVPCVRTASELVAAAI